MLPPNRGFRGPGGPPGGPPGGAVQIRFGGPGRGGRFGPATPPVPLRDLPGLLRDSVAVLWSTGRGRLVVAAGAQLVVAAVEGGQRVSSAQAVESVLGNGSWRDRDTARRLGTAGGLQVVAGLARVAARQSADALQHEVATEVERRILAVVATADIADLEDPAFLDELQRAGQAAHAVVPLVHTMLGLGSGLTGAVAAGVGLWAVDPALVPLVAASVVPEWFLVRHHHRQNLQDSDASTADARERQYLRSVLTNGRTAKELRTFGATEVLQARHDDLAESLSEVERKQQRRQSRQQLLINGLNAATVAPIAGVAGRRLLRGDADVAGTTAAALAGREMAKRMRRVTGSFNGLQRWATGVRAYRTFVDRQPPARELHGRSAPATFDRIRVEDLTFSYPHRPRPVLQGVSFEIAQGETVALVGENGSGKSTLAKLLCFLYQPDAGRILWDDVDTATCDPADLRSHLAVVFQDFNQYAMSAAMNIGIGRPEAIDDREAIVAAAQLAGADTFLSQLPKGYDTLLSAGFGGVDLSTGQWQRVALARAFMRDAPLVILDEPTAALDARAEHELFEAVRSLYHGRSALLISHRLSSVRAADRILVIDGGRIVEDGPHDELIAAGGVYADLFGLQARSYR